MQLPIPVAMIKHPDQKKQPKGRKGLFNPQFQVLLHHSEEVKAETQSYHIHYQEKRKKGCLRLLSSHLVLYCFYSPSNSQDSFLQTCPEANLM